MSHFLALTRHDATLAHDLTHQSFASHPNLTWRIIFFVLPYLFSLMVSLALVGRVLRIHHNNFIKVFPSNPYLFIAFIVAYIGAAIVGLYAVISDAWTGKQWVLFAVVCVLIGLKSLIFILDTSLSLIVTSILMIIICVLNELLFVELRDMVEANQNELAWKHTTRNFIGFIEAVVIIYTFLFLTQVLVYVFKATQRSAGYFFWIATPLVVILILIWNIVSFGPFLDSIGYIVAALLLFLGAAVSTLFHKVDSQGQPIPLKQ